MIRRRRRILAPLATPLSLLLCIGVCTMWVRSHWVADSWVWWRGDRHNQLKSAAGQISLAQWRLPAGWPTTPGHEPHEDVRHKRAAPDRADDTDVSYSNIMGVRRHWHVLGFRWMISDGGRGALSNGLVFTTAPGRDVTIPYWFPVLLLALPPAGWCARRWGRRHRACSGQCTACGYDLRASPDRCPECGTPVAAAGSDAAS